LVFLLFNSGLAYSADNICFSESTSKAMVVELDKCQILKSQIILYDQSNTELQKTIDLLNVINAKKSETITDDEKMISTYKTALTNQEKECKEQIQNAKPTFKEEVIKAGIYSIIGVIIGLLL